MTKKTQSVQHVATGLFINLKFEKIPWSAQLVLVTVQVYSFHFLFFFFFSSLFLTAWNIQSVRKVSVIFSDRVFSEENRRTKLSFSCVSHISEKTLESGSAIINRAVCPPPPP